MKFTVDLMCGWAHPGTKMVQNSPQGLKGWFFHLLHRKLVAPDGRVRMYAIRLIGLTVGVTVTRECVTELTPAASPQAPFIGDSSPRPAGPTQVQLSPEHLAQIQAIIAASQSEGTTKTTTSPAQ